MYRRYYRLGEYYTKEKKMRLISSLTITSLDTQYITTVFSKTFNTTAKVRNVKKNKTRII